MIAAVIIGGTDLYGGYAGVRYTVSGILIIIPMNWHNYKKDLESYRKFLSEESPLPLYYQVAYLLEHYIEEIELQDGNAFFSEEHVAMALNVSRPTVNRAIKMLINKGYLERLRGRGTTVRKAGKVPIALMSELISYGQMLSRMGMDFRTVLIDRMVVTPSAQIAAKLNLHSGEKVIRLKRLREAQKEPLLVQGSIDAHTGMLGLGVTRTGELAVIMGTSFIHLALSDKPIFAKGLRGPYPNVIIPGLWLIEEGGFLPDPSPAGFAITWPGILSLTNTGPISTWPKKPAGCPRVRKG